MNSCILLLSCMLMIRVRFRFGELLRRCFLCIGGEKIIRIEKLILQGNRILEFVFDLVFHLCYFSVKLIFCTPQRPLQITDAFAENTSNLRQFFRPENNENNDEYDDKFLYSYVKHGGLL